MKTIQCIPGSDPSGFDGSNCSSVCTSKWIQQDIIIMEKKKYPYRMYCGILNISKLENLSNYVDFLSVRYHYIRL